MNENEERLERYFNRFGEWVAKKPIGPILGRFPSWFLFIILILLQSAYWATAWWSPIPFLVFTLGGFVLMTYLGKGPLAIYSLNLRQAATTDIGAKMIVIGLPFFLAQVAAIFACLYMLGVVKTSGGDAIHGTWEHFYFSVVTLTTLGYGNLVPSDRWAEMVAVVESLIGFMVFAIYAGALASIALRRSLGPDDFESRILDQGGAVLTNEQIQELNIDQEIGTRYFLRYIYVTIYGSQYRLLQALDSDGPLALDMLKTEYYAIFVSQLPNATQPPAFNEWLGYLIENMLIVASGDGLSYEITVNGVRFLTEIKNTGANDNFAS
jgi:hypothetical protein